MVRVRSFLLRTSALAHAIGAIIGVALGTVVSSLVDDVIMPPIGLVLGGVDFSELRVVLREATAGDPSSEVAIRRGAFLNAVISFVVVSFVVWRMSKVFVREEAPSGPPPQEVLLSEIRDELRAANRIRPDWWFAGPRGRLDRSAPCRAGARLQQRCVGG